MITPYVQQIRDIAKSIDGAQHAKAAADLLHIARELECAAHDLADAAVPCDTFFEGLVDQRPSILGAITAQARITARRLIGTDKVDAKRKSVEDMLGNHCPKAVA